MDCPEWRRRPARPLALQVETPDLLYPGQLEAPGHFLFWRASGLAGQSIGGYHHDIALSYDPLFTRPARPLALQVKAPDHVLP